jgi:hypothetical protein
VTDWPALRRRVGAGSAGGRPRPAPDPAADGVDDAIDDALDGLSDAPTDTADPAETEALLACLAAARSQSTVRDVARAMAARTAASAAATVGDAIAAAYAQRRADAVLGPALLRSLATLGERVATVRAAAAAALRGVVDADPPFLRVEAARLVGRFEGLGLMDDGRPLLTRWTDAPEPAVAGEARYQLALLDTLLALREEDLDALEGRLRIARVELVRAEASEESRPDARRLLLLADVLLAYLSYRHDPADAAGAAATLRSAAAALKAAIDDPVHRPWPGLATAREAALEFRLYRAAVGFLDLAEAIAEPEEWTNLDEALVAAAAALAVVSESPAPGAGAPAAGPVPGALDTALPRTGPVLGPLLRRAVGRRRFARVIAHYEAVRGRDATADTLHRIYAAIAAEDYGTAGAAA